MDASIADSVPARPLDEPPADRLTIQYTPAADTEITEKPPRFTWIPAIEDELAYVLPVSAADGSERLYPDIPVNSFMPPDMFPAGNYMWKYCPCGNDRPASAWSRLCTSPSLRACRKPLLPHARPATRLWRTRIQGSDRTAQGPARFARRSPGTPITAAGLPSWTARSYPGRNDRRCRARTLSG